MTEELLSRVLSKCDLCGLVAQWCVMKRKRVGIAVKACDACLDEERTLPFDERTLDVRTVHFLDECEAQGCTT